MGLVIGIAWLGGAGDDDDDHDLIAPRAEHPVHLTGSTVPTSGPASTAPGSTVAPAGFAYGTGECPPEEVTEPVRSFDRRAPAVHRPGRDVHGDVPHERGRHRRRPRHRRASRARSTTSSRSPATATTTTRASSAPHRASPARSSRAAAETNADSPGYTIPDEGAGFVYEAGQLVMARTPEPNSAGGQWFFVTDPPATPDPTGTYVVFGTITEGLDVARAIRELGGDDGAPSREVTVETVEITET